MALPAGYAERFHLQRLICKKICKMKDGHSFREPNDIGILQRIRAMRLKPSAVDFRAVAASSIVQHRLVLFFAFGKGFLAPS